MESVIRFIVSNRLVTILLGLIFALSAWVQLPELRISQYPAVELPTLMINVLLPGASALELEQRVITDLEDKLENTRGVNKFQTTINNSFASIMIEYRYGVDLDDEYTEINAKINNLKTDLPADTEITVLKQSPIDMLVSFLLAVTSDTARHDELVSSANELKDAIRKVKNIEEVSLIKPEEEIQVVLDLARMNRYGISIQQVHQAIRGNNRFLPTGTVNFGDKAVSILAFSGGYKQLDAIRDTMLMSSTGSALALRDIATIQKRIVNDSIITQVDGKAAIWVEMKMNEFANVFEVKAGLNQAIEATVAKLDEGMNIVWLFDVESGVNFKLRQLITNIMIGIGILGVVLFFSVGYRSSMIIALMLPLVLLLSLIGLSFTDYGIQEISLAGFIISLGLIVDNGIVVTENAYKLKTYRGMDDLEAAVIGTSSVIAPLLSSTLTTALAFAPLFLLTSPVGLFLHSMVATIWLCLGTSLLVAITLTTLLLARIGTENRFLKLPQPPSFLKALIPFRDKGYREILEYFIAKPLHLIAMVTVLFIATGFVARLLPVIVFPDSEDPYFTVTILAPSDRTLDHVEELAEEAARIASKAPDVERCSTIVGSSFPFVNTGVPMIGSGRNKAVIFCEVNFRDSARLTALTDSINQKFAHLKPLASIDASPFAVGGTPGESDVEVNVIGYRIDGVREVARALGQHLREADLAGVRNIDNPAESRWFALNIQFKERVANALGISRAQVDQVLVLLTHGAEVDDFRDDLGEEYPIVLRAETDFEDPLAVFDRIFVMSSRGSPVPLSQVVEVSFGEDEYPIEHSLFRPQVSVSITAEPGIPVAELTQRVIERAATFEMPEGYSVEFKGEVASTEEAFGGAGKYTGIIGLVVIGIFLLQFKSLMQPLIICAAIPLSFIGAFLMLWLTGQPMSFLAFIGLTSLMGIVINNSILLVDEGNQLRRNEPHLPIMEVAIKAGINRFMPIVLTSITSIFGLLPLALGNTMFKALAIVVIGGLTTSTFLTLICVPVLYAFVTRGPVSEPVTSNWSGRTSLGEERD